MCYSRQKERGHARKRFKHKSLLAAPQDEPGAVSLINKVQQQLSAMEKKLDILISQSSKRPFEKSYIPKSLPGPSITLTAMTEEEEAMVPGKELILGLFAQTAAKNARSRSSPAEAVRYIARKCFSKRRKDNPFNANRDNGSEQRDFPRERHFDKRQAKKRQKPDTKNKPFYARINKHG